MLRPLESEGVTVRRRGESIADAIRRMGNGGILVATAAWAGLDTPNRWASILVPRVPFPRPTILDEKSVSRYVDSKNIASRRMAQALGRGLRAPDANGDVRLLDERVQTSRRLCPCGSSGPGTRRCVGADHDPFGGPPSGAQGGSGGLDGHCTKCEGEADLQVHYIGEGADRGARYTLPDIRQCHPALWRLRRLNQAPISAAHSSTNRARSDTNRARL